MSNGLPQEQFFSFRTKNRWISTTNPAQHVNGVKQSDQLCLILKDNQIKVCLKPKRRLNQIEISFSI